MTEYDTRVTPDPQKAFAAVQSTAVAPPTGTEPGGESLTSTAQPATAPTTTTLGAEESVGLEVTAELERAAELAVAVERGIMEGLSALGDVVPDGPAELEAEPEPEAEQEPEPEPQPEPGATAEPVQVWVDAGEVLAGLGVDGWPEQNRLDERIRTLHEELGPRHQATLAAIDDRRALAALSLQDEETYQDALVAAVEQIALERGISVEVRPVTTGQANAAGTPAAELHAAAVSRAVLPQLGRAPFELAADLVARAVIAAGRTYTERIRTAERPQPAAEHDRLESELQAELQADELLPEDPAPPLAAADTAI